MGDLLTILREPAELEAENIGTLELVFASGITYRMADYWTRTGLLRANDSLPGSGYARTYPRIEISVATLIRRFTRAGLEPRAAEPLARQLLEHGHAELAGIRIDLPQEQP